MIPIVSWTKSRTDAWDVKVLAMSDYMKKILFILFMSHVCGRGRIAHRLDSIPTLLDIKQWKSLLFRVFLGYFWQPTVYCSLSSYANVTYFLNLFIYFMISPRLKDDVMNIKICFPFRCCARICFILQQPQPLKPQSNQVVYFHWIRHWWKR